MKNSLICKAALHDGRVAPWDTDNSTVLITNTSVQSSTFISALRNGIVSGQLIGSSYLVYQFASNRINGLNKNKIKLNIKIKYFHLETSIPDIAIEHRGYLYTQDQSSSITCRSKTDLYPIQPINIDQGCMKYLK